MVIISGIGVREYYRRHGYRKEGPYVTKPLR
jgi:elongator complex protein 3